MTNLDFRFWLFSEEADGLETRQGNSFLNDPVMKAAMYLAYRASYNEVAKADYEEDLHNLVKTGVGEEEAKTQIKFQPPWSVDHWMASPTGGTRAPNWIFLGRFPSQTDLQQINQLLEKHQGNLQELADSGEVSNMPGVGGVSYRDTGSAIKMTGLWGWNPNAKMTAVAHLTHQANQSGKQIFTGADSKLMDMINRSKGLMARAHKQGKVPAPDFGLTSPPPEVVPFLYDVVTRSDVASGGGNWAGHNPDGSLNYNLGGIGMRKKFLLGNKPLWQSQIKNALGTSGMNDPAKLTQVKAALEQPGPMSQMAATMVNKQLQKSMPGSKDIPASGLLWLLNHLD